jgi:hypothetical protein
MSAEEITMRIANNTTYTNRNGIKEVTLHKTVILRQEGDTVTLNTGGWFTATTKNRINRYLVGAEVIQRNNEWLVHINGQELPFEDGMTIKGAIDI